jgi:hypothetical protein
MKDNSVLIDGIVCHIFFYWNAINKIINNSHVLAEYKEEGQFIHADFAEAKKQIALSIKLLDALNSDDIKECTDNYLLQTIDILQTQFVILDNRIG